MKRLIPLFIVALIVLALIAVAFRLGTRSGVSDAQVRETLPGDSIIPNPWISIDRAAVLPASANISWPWVEQLGKDRAGWYAPMWLENTLKEHSATTTEPQFQNLKIGDVVPDWGGGALKVLEIDPGHYVVYGSVRPIAPYSTDAEFYANASSTAALTNYAFTWTLILEDSTASSTTFHLRLRLQQPEKTWQRYAPAAPLGLIDYATDVVMFEGLKQKLAAL